jgi:hypothetical protein
MSRTTLVRLLVAASCLGLPAGAHAGVVLSTPTIVVPAGAAGSVVATVSGPAQPVSQLRLAPTSSSASPAGAWLQVAPVSVGPLSPPVSAPFTVVVRVPAGTAPGTYAGELVASADGVDAGRATVAVQVPALGFGLTGARIDGSWAQSRFQGQLTIAGQLSDPARIDLTLQAKGQRALRLSTSSAAGPFSITIADLPSTLRPGSYRLQAVAHGGGQATTAVRTVTLAAPSQGVVDQAAVSGTRGGAPTASLPGKRFALWVSFHFAARPHRQTVTVTFYPPGAPPATIEKPMADTVVADVTAGPPAGLPHGRWRIVLRAGATVIRELSVVIGG